jgi:MerR family transcriptional regulator, light-induced transcriptional regulator
MRYLKTSEAATLLKVSPATLRAWESRFAFPTPQRSTGNQRMYLHAEVTALRETLRGCGSTASAVRVARETLAARDSSLIAALGGYDRSGADVAMEAALGSRSLQRCVEGVLLPTLEQIARQRTLESAAWAFAAQWGAGWLRRATRLAAARSRSLSIVLGDASRDELDPDAPLIRALELFCVRAGVDVMSLSVRGVAGLGDALAARRPDAVVIAGGQIADAAVAAWAQSVRAAAGVTPIALYRPGDQLARMPTTGATVLPARASDAHHRVIELAQTQRATATPPARLAPHDSHEAMIQNRQDSRTRGHDHYRQAAGGHGA